MKGKGFLPGHDPRRNLRGRPRKGTAIAEILRAIGDEKHDRHGTKRMAMLQRIYTAAMQGDMDAAKFIADRTEGKVTDMLRIDGGQRLEIVEELVEATSPVPG
jgi:hypothetical protein